MVFSSMVFLTCALPVVLLVYYLLPHAMKNLWLLLFSLAFYAWGEPRYIVLMLLSIAVNALCAHWMVRRPAQRRVALVLSVVFNIGMLLVFKYLSLFIQSANAWLSLNLNDPRLPLPIGISFYTFQAMSYVIDVYRDEEIYTRNPLDVALYISLFPQLIAGPIVRYPEVAREIQSRSVSPARFAQGMERFIVGLGKKVLIANVLGRVADQAFSLGGAQLHWAAAWIGLLCYAGQIYYDFSGYSDMAIGLGAFFGFNFPENFNYPYSADSMKAFWSRWHMTLNTWFRDYVYIPLGGRSTTGRTIRNLSIVFALTGLWHGASWNFLLWGLYHGCFRVAEEFLPKERRGFNLLRHAYVLLVVLFGWVLFRAETLTGAMDYFKSLFGFGGGGLLTALDPHGLTMLALGAALSVGAYGKVHGALREKPGYDWVRWAGLTAILLLSLSALSVGTYNPFIYFRF